MRLKIGIALFVALSCCDIATAYEYCGSSYYCPDQGSEIGYCCGWTYNNVALCCSYMAWYSLWYVWTSIVIFILLVSSCSVCCKRHRDRQQQQVVTTRARPVTVTTVTTDANGVVNKNYQPYTPHPPSYASIQQQQVKQHPPPPAFDQSVPPYPGS